MKNDYSGRNMPLGAPAPVVQLLMRYQGFL